MKTRVLIVVAILGSFSFGYFFKVIFNGLRTQKAVVQQTVKTDTTKTNSGLKLGAFSISLSVKDLNVSKAFYEGMGFTVFAGSMTQNYLIMKNENALIGLFQGMFQGNILTFNPGWDENAKNIEKFDDVREIQRQLKGKGVKPSTQADERTTGPASLMFTDPDGNVILIDQHR